MTLIGKPKHIKAFKISLPKGLIFELWIRLKTCSQMMPRIANTTQAIKPNLTKFLNSSESLSMRPVSFSVSTLFTC